MIKEKKCKLCKRIIVGDNKIGICPVCRKKYGGAIGIVGVGLISVGGLSKTIYKIVKK